MLWVVRLRFVLQNRCVQSLAEVPPIFGMLTLACKRDVSLVRSRGSIEQTEFGKLKLADLDVGRCCGGSHATPRLILRLYVDYAQEVSVEREHDPLGMRVVAWAWECGKFLFRKNTAKGVYVQKSSWIGFSAAEVFKPGMPTVRHVRGW